MGMMAVGASAEAVAPYLQALPDNANVVIACYNSPQSITLSGDRAALERLSIVLASAGVFARLLKVDIAYHSAYMNAIAEHYHEEIRHIVPGQSNMARMISSVTGDVIDGLKLDSAYWVHNMCSVVQFEHAVANACRSVASASRARQSVTPPIGFALEIGPHSALHGPLRQTLVKQGQDKQVAYASMLTRGENARSTALRAAGALWSHGYNVDPVRANTIGAAARYEVVGDLPSYPWKCAFSTHSSMARLTPT
jgi:acyl transferase domain-containing protein